MNAGGVKGFKLGQGTGGRQVISQGDRDLKAPSGSTGQCINHSVKEAALHNSLN